MTFRTIYNAHRSFKLVVVFPTILLAWNRFRNCSTDAEIPGQRLYLIQVRWHPMTGFIHLRGTSLLFITCNCVQCNCVQSILFLPMQLRGEVRLHPAALCERRRGKATCILAVMLRSLLSRNARSPENIGCHGRSLKLIIIDSPAQLLT